MGSKVAIRETQHGDITAITDIYNDAILNTTAVYSYEPVTSADRLDWFSSKIDNSYPVFVATSGLQVVGFATYGSFRAWPAYLHTIEHSVYVDAEQRGRGVGRALLEKLIEDATSKNYHVLIAGIDAENQASLRLHEGLGFGQVAHFKEVGFKFDRWLDLVFMQRFLSKT